MRRVEYCYEGCFWLVGETIDGIQNGKFKFFGQKLRCTHDGTIVTKKDSKKAKFLSHEQICENPYARQVLKKFKRYPRGKVRVLDGYVYVTLPPRMKSLTVTTRINKEFDLEGLIPVWDIDMNFAGEIA